MQLDTTKNYLLAFSGGRDSLVLFNILKSRGIRFTCVHVNHGLSKNADKWQEFCVNYCKRHKTQLSCYRVDIDVNAASIEADARNKRYYVMSKMFETYGCFEALLTGHHKDDNIETILFNILRGGELTSMDGIGQSTELFGMKILRPMLSVTRNEIDAFLQIRGITEWNEDESNASSEFTRNFLRNEILPKLREKFNNVDNALSEFASKAKLANEYKEKWLTNIQPARNAADFYELYQMYHSSSDFETDCVTSIINRRLIQSQQVYLSRGQLSELCRLMFTIKHGKTKIEKVFNLMGAKIERCYNLDKVLILKF
jgi:tRNA(Ile)-lysidine synthetase-like protein